MGEEGSPYIEIVNWDKYQHYKNRDPPWIKLYNAMLDDPDFMRLQDASRWLAVGLMLLASRTENQVPADGGWLQWRLRLSSPPDLEPLVTIGFIRIHGTDASTMLARCYQDDSAEGEGEGEREVTDLGGEPPEGGQGGTEVLGGSEFPPPSQLPRDGQHYVYPEEFEVAWQVYPDRTGGNPKKGAYRCWRTRVKQGAKPSELYDGVKRYRAFCEHEGKVGSRYVLMAKTFFGSDEPWKEDWIPDELNDADREMFRRRQRMEEWDLNGGDDDATG